MLNLQDKIVMKARQIFFKISHPINHAAMANEMVRPYGDVSIFGRTDITPDLRHPHHRKPVKKLERRHCHPSS